MSRESKLVKNTAIITIGKICTQLITFFLLPLYTAILSTEEYGTVDLLNTLVSLLLPIVTFQIEQAVFRHLIEVRNDELEKKKIISTSFFTVIFHISLYLIIFLIISPFVNNEYKYFLATNVVAYIFSSLFLQLARGVGDNKRYAIGSFLTALSTIIFNILFLVVIKLGANGMLLANMLGQIVCFIYILFSLKIYKYISLKFVVKEIRKKLLKYSIPLIPNAISWWIFNASDRLIVSTVLGVDQNGILAASHKFSTVYITFYNIFNMSWTESVSLQINDLDFNEFFNKMFNTVLKLFTAMAIGIIACMFFVYPVMINVNYISGYDIVPVLMLGSLFNVIVGLISTVYVAKKNTKAIANTSIISAIINIVVHLLLVNYIGLFAAAVSTLVAFVIMSFYRLYDIKKKYFSIKFDKKFIIKTIIVLPIILVLYYINNLYLNVLNLLIAIVYAWNINRDSIHIVLNLIKKKLNLTKKEA